VKFSRSTVRLIIAVAAGIVISKVLDVLAHLVLYKAGIFPALDEPMLIDKDLLTSLAIHSLFAAVSAFVTALIAKEQARKATYILGTKEAIFWLIGAVLLLNHYPFWVNIAKAVLGPPLCWIGWRTYEMVKRETD